jgi:hypothetical protein
VSAQAHATGLSAVGTFVEGKGLSRRSKQARGKLGCEPSNSLAGRRSPQRPVVAGIVRGKVGRHARAHSEAAPPRLSVDAVNQAKFAPSLKSDRANPGMLKAEILLDRAAISPGQIDGKDGENARKAIAAFPQLHGLDPNGRLDGSPDVGTSLKPGGGGGMHFALCHGSGWLIRDAVPLRVVLILSERTNV